MAADSNYFPYACLTARRILDVSAPIDGFILHVKVHQSDLQVARRLLGNRVALLDVSDFMDRVGFRFGTYSIAAYVRLFADLLPQFDGYGRVAYTDCDVLFNRDINDLACQGLDAPLLAAHDDYMYFRPSYRKSLGMQPGAPYFNSGVVVFDMDAVRTEGLLERTRQTAVHGKMNDQNALNVAFEGKWQTMHPNWNLMSNGTRDYRFSQAYARHFAGGKPWGNQIGVEPEALKVWRDLAKGTPWGKPFEQRVPFERGVMKRFTRRFDVIAGLFGKDVQRRRARYDGAKMHLIYARQADAGEMAVQFPEVLGGFG
ncbi:glycosyltransferase family 8 protein [Mesorhizobium dulcispinae]|uniref:glycosyltransferase family 8 protein n=1 Tax=Mesorhizobium dulcispinae TaxID=3072316 RepID=UPI002A24EE00|nr:glycosyltransferase [Mesorhizobium sp. VK23D]MDX8517325.1 glycosyltransferase [Mesorhizobium sp. VK23D]